METTTKNLKRLNTLGWYFIILGFAELFILIFLTQSFFAGIIGLLTLVPAYLAQNDKAFKWNYVVGIWSILRFNPIVAAMVAFILTDLFSVFSASGQTAFNPLPLLAGYGVVALVTLPLAIVLIVFTSKQLKLEKGQAN